ncbi:MAG TPA: phosphotransferase, partial [Longimicrobiaceae bacterium]|nr:phosphotransferase [Longimicrobiaceae bacterium]
LPIPAELTMARPEDLLASTWAQLDGFPLPGFVADAVASVRAERPPASGETPVLSHNDLNPTNMVYDGERLVLLDWDAASTNDRAYDLATVAVFMRMDAETCAKLHAAYAGQPAEAMPPRFAYLRRLIGMMVGTGFVNAARQAGHPGTAPDATLESTLSLTECYPRMRTGEVNLATPEGRMTFGLARVKESFVANESS